MNKQTKPNGKAAQPTAEQLEQQARRAFLQKRNAIAEGILFNAVRGAGTVDFDDIAVAAVNAADTFMAKCYSVSIIPQEKVTE